MTLRLRGADAQVNGSTVRGKEKGPAMHASPAPRFQMTLCFDPDQNSTCARIAIELKS
jgi:hypothetical protein